MGRKPAAQLVAFPPGKAPLLGGHQKPSPIWEDAANWPLPLRIRGARGNERDDPDDASMGIAILTPAIPMTIFNRRACRGGLFVA
jgi:hypothetical protein